MALSHIVIATRDRQRLFASENALRRGVRALARVAGRELALFTFVDDHLHAPAHSERPDARLRQAIHQALAPIVDAPLQPSYTRPIEGRRHLERLVGYILEQGQRHGLTHDSPLWTGSCFLDLAGARAIPGLSLRIQQLLPRFRLPQVFDHVGLAGASLQPASRGAIYAAGLDRLARAAESAAAIGPEAVSSGTHSRDARLVVATLGLDAGFASSDISRTLGIERGSVTRMVKRPLPAPRQEQVARLARATRVRLSLEDLVRNTRSPSPAVWPRSVTDRRG